MLNDLSTIPYLDLSNIYLFGESMGAAAAAFWTMCIRSALGEPRLARSVRAFGMHSQGLKIRGDGNKMDVMPYTPFVDAPKSANGVRLGECDDCQWYPVIPQRLDARACVFGSPLDTRYGSTLRQMVDTWRQLGNPVTHVMHALDAQPGSPPPPAMSQHCYWYSYYEMLSCLDPKLFASREAE